MSLNFNLSQIQDYKVTCFNVAGEMVPATESLIFSTLVVGIPEITKGNHETFLRRLNLWETARGYDLTPAAVVKAHIGLKTNASPRSKARFITHMKNIMYETLPAELRQGVR